MGLPAKKVIQLLIGPVHTDQRVHKMCFTLQQLGYEAELLVCWPTRVAITRPYPVRQLRTLFRRGPLFYAEANLRLWLAAMFTPLDILTANDLFTLPAAYLASRLRGKALVYDTHEYFLGMTELLSRPKVQALWRFLERTLLPRVKTIATVNPEVAARYAAEYGKQPVVIRNLPFRNTQGNHPDPTARILLYQGSIQRGRGLELMVAGMRYLPDYKLWLIGGGYLLPTLKLQIAKLALEGRIRCFGALPFEALGALTAQASLGLSLEQDEQPGRGPTNLQLSTPNKVYDYLQQHLPILVSALPGLRGIVEQWGCGLVLTENTPEAFAHAVRQIVDDTARYTKFSTQAALAAAALHWETQIDALAALYNSAALPL